MCLYNENSREPLNGPALMAAVTAAVPRRGFWFQLTSCGGTGSWPHCVEKRGRAAFSLASSGFPNSAFIRAFGFLHNALHGRYIRPRLPRHSITAGTQRYQRDDGKSASRSDSDRRLR
ncbi:hypothetical protein QQF64_001790 [Cirrhinus molitorella]|uniref:Uncharacterized protein n=1 Tax=Cirrhinus molitorella TaxID=172907 RepID=A0ABR3MNA7_9TELE